MKKINFMLIALAVMTFASCKQNPQSEQVMSKDFLELAADRYSVRHFTDTPVEQEKIDKIIQAGRLAPTAVNSQPQIIYIASSKEAMEKLNKLSPCIYGAPQCIVACYTEENAVARGNGNYGDIDVTIVLTHMMLEAANLGVGTCLVGNFNPEDLVSELDLPSGVHPVLLMPFGYAAEDAVPSPRHTEYRPKEETVKSL